jgi:CRP-like cAMP-binding protein
MASPNSDRVKFLSTVDILADAASADLSAIAAACQEKSFKAGELIFKEGSPSPSVLIIRRGHVRCSRAGQDITTLQAGETFGVASFLDKSPRNVDAVAEGEVTLWILERAAVERLSKDHPVLAQGLTSVMNRHLRSVLDVAVSRRTMMGG